MCLCDVASVFLSLCLSMSQSLYQRPRRRHTGSRHLAHQVHSAISTTYSPVSACLDTTFASCTEAILSPRPVQPSCPWLSASTYWLTISQLSLPTTCKEGTYLENSILFPEEASGRALSSDWETSLHPLHLILPSCSDPHLLPSNIIKPLFLGVSNLMRSSLLP